MGLPLLPSRRLIAIDAGSHAIKIILAERFGKSVRVLRQESINLRDEGLLSAEEIGPALAAILQDMGDHPVALALPQNLPLSNILDLTDGSKAVKQMIEAETHKNRDLRDSPVVYDFARLQPFGRHQNAFLVTLCKENDILEQITRLSLLKEDVCEVVAPANVLATAYQATTNPSGHVAIADIGASGTLVTLCVGGQAVHAASFPIGGNLFSETLATTRNCSVEAAEALKQTTNLLTGSARVQALAAVVDAWRDELKRAIEGWLSENPELKLSLSSIRLVLSGGGAEQPGLIEFLNEDGGLTFERWPDDNVPGVQTMPRQFNIAYGAALQALGAVAQSASLLPAVLREDWGKRRVHQHLLTGIFAVLIATIILLALGTAQKFTAANRKEVLMEQAKLALEKAEQTALLRRNLTDNYERLRPVLRKGQQTLDTLKTLSLLEQSRTNRNLWYVLFADQPSYFASRTTNLFQHQRPAFNGTTNMLPQRSGFIAELCINQEGEAMRQTLGQVVGELKQSSMFSNVDTLPSDLRRDMAQTDVILPGRHFALSLELVSSDFAPVPLEEKPAATNSTPPLVRGTKGTATTK